MCFILKSNWEINIGIQKNYGLKIMFTNVTTTSSYLEKSGTPDNLFQI